ncbi:MAG: hypothetical protein Q7R87_01585 [Nanoarchaeota archaeon]|nr:hypothetical protein [Nanoarchaeota archaeon]
MSEVQSHGFTFERWIKNVLNVDEPASKYTQKWDILDKIPISIKCMGKSNALELSSAIRFWENDKPFLLIIGRWEQVGAHKTIISIDEILIGDEIMNKLRGSLTLKELKEFNSKIISFPAGKKGQKEGIIYANKWKNENANKIGLITITHKIDSKNQRRLQCNVNYQNYLKIFGQPSWRPLFRGQIFEGTIDSTSRVFNKSKI